MKGRVVNVFSIYVSVLPYLSIKQVGNKLDPNQFVAASETISLTFVLYALLITLSRSVS